MCAPRHARSHARKHERTHVPTHARTRAQIMTPRLENCRSEHDLNMINLVYQMERLTGGRPAVSTIDASPDGKAIVVMDFKGYSMSNAPPMKSARVRGLSEHN